MPPAFHCVGSVAGSSHSVGGVRVHRLDRTQARQIEDLARWLDLEATGPGIDRMRE